MNKEQRVRQLADLCELLRDRTNEIFDSARYTSELIGKDSYPTIVASRLENIEELMRDMAQRYVRMADEVATL